MKKKAAKKKTRLIDLTKEQLLRKCKRVGAKCNASMNKRQLVARYVAACRKPKKKKTVACRRPKTGYRRAKRKSAVRKSSAKKSSKKRKVIYSAAGKNVSDVNKDLKKHGLKIGKGRKSTKIARLRAFLSKKRKGRK